MVIATFISIFNSLFYIFTFSYFYIWFIDVCRNVTLCVQLPLDYLILLDNEPRGPNLWEIKHGLSGCVP